MKLISLKYKLSEFQLWKALKKNAINNTIIVVFSNYDYRHVLDVWISSIYKIKVKNFLIISLDKNLHEHLLSRSIPTYYYKTSLKNRADLWINRTMFISKVLHLGFNIIHSDADAFWCRDPQPEYFNFHHSDVVFSQGTIFPPEIHDKWGFVLCCGLYGIKSNKNTRKLISRVIEDLKDSKDDQRSFNRVIYESCINWDTCDTYELLFRDRIVKCSKKIVTGTSKDYKVSLLPHQQFQRLEENVDNVYVKHWLLSRDKLIKDLTAKLKK